MKNKERYRVPQERDNAFKYFCLRHGCLYCPIGKVVNIVAGTSSCAFHWLEMEYKEEEDNDMNSKTEKLLSEQCRDVKKYSETENKIRRKILEIVKLFDYHVCDIDDYFLDNDNLDVYYTGSYCGCRDYGDVFFPVVWLDLEKEEIRKLVEAKKEEWRKAAEQQKKEEQEKEQQEAERKERKEYERLRAKYERGSNYGK